MSDLPGITRGTGVPPKNPKLHWIESVEARSSIRFRIWSSAIWEFWTHYGGRTKPCFENHAFCEGGHDEANLRWYGYLFGWHEPRNGTAFVQLTEGCARILLGAVAKGVSLRGMIVTFSRGASKQGPMLVKVDRYCNTDHANMGADCDPLESCYRLWKVKHVGHAARLSLVSGPADLVATPDEVECLKADAGALSIKEAAGVSRTKKRSKKLIGKREPA